MSDLTRASEVAEYLAKSLADELYDAARDQPATFRAVFCQNEKKG